LFHGLLHALEPTSWCSFSRRLHLDRPFTQHYDAFVFEDTFNTISRVFCRCFKHNIHNRWITLWASVTLLTNMITAYSPINVFVYYTQISAYFISWLHSKFELCITHIS
jgi:hypothetical protein